MFMFKITKQLNGSFCLNNQDYLTMIYVHDGEIDVFHHHLHKVTKVPSGYYTIIPFNELSYVSTNTSQCTMVTINAMIVSTLARDVIQQWLSHDYSLLSYHHHKQMIQNHINQLIDYTSLTDLHLNTEVTFRISYLLMVLINDLNTQTPLSLNMNHPLKQKYLLSNQMRIFDATIDLITNPHKSIAAIATDYGFYDQSHFTKAFKKYRQITPYAFRQSYLKDMYYK
ncbi:helix-turn-helix domain-containing protein [Mammaliicoccus sp. Dog046]|uniref:helix-turn-helix domain-containing protein n=1 Tax=Mammaliicoccus sp. Dog046 TaxID=3034233 RepID=UPI002B25878E|nr:helix-turn-helix domain-containing protein [Mammaliicoccus sp. Dog046]WQK86370.1 helix-turn-helix domain-containing protein [Mammaliicoccus sp. Dog046]